MCVCMHVYYIYIYIHSIYTSDTLHMHVQKWYAAVHCKHVYMSMNSLHTPIRCSATAKTCKGASSKPFCASTNWQKKIICLTTTWNDQICVWARCVFIQLRKSTMLLLQSSGHSHCHSICTWPLKGLFQTCSKIVQKLWTFECRNKKKFAP
jgi:hypothetical protein